MSLEEVATLIEREHRLHQEWLSALSSLEAFLHNRTTPNQAEITFILQDIMDQLTITQKEIMEKISKHSLNQAFFTTHVPDPIIEHILTLYGNIDLLQQKIQQKHQDLRMYHPIQQQSRAAQPVQLALDHSMDLLKQLVNFPR